MRSKMIGITGSASVMGASHKGAKAKNQDSVKSFSDENISVIAVADGHGSAKYFRSALGSKGAVEIATAEMKEFLWQYDLSATDERKHYLVSQFKKLVLNQWRCKAYEHLAANPYGEEANELKLTEKDLKSLEFNPLSLYGSTLMVVGANERYMVVLQIGDGDILAINDEGVVQELTPKSEVMIANQTTSLCDKNALENMNVTIYEGRFPFVMASTDGVCNSFGNENDFIDLARDIFEDVVKQDDERVAKLLGEVLRTLTTKGSGDDCSIAYMLDGNLELLWFKDYVKKYNNPNDSEIIAAPPDEYEAEKSQETQSVEKTLVEINSNEKATILLGENDNGT